MLTNMENFMLFNMHVREHDMLFSDEPTQDVTFHRYYIINIIEFMFCVHAVLCKVTVK